MPTAKAWSLFETGEALYRGDEPSPARSSVLVRLAHSHLRFGTFQRLAYLGDTARLAKLLDFAVAHYHPGARRASPAETALAFLGEVARRAAELAAGYLLAGFVHGVLNTDNLNVTGESFDYGPYRFVADLRSGLRRRLLRRDRALRLRPAAMGHLLGGGLGWPRRSRRSAPRRRSPRRSPCSGRRSPRRASGASWRGSGWHSAGPTTTRCWSSPRSRSWRRAASATSASSSISTAGSGARRGRSPGRRGSGTSAPRTSRCARCSAGYQPARPEVLEAPYFQGDAPCTLLIDEVRAHLGRHRRAGRLGTLRGQDRGHPRVRSPRRGVTTEPRRPFPRDLLLFPERRRPFPRDLLLFPERRRPFPRDLLLFPERRRPFPRDLLLFPERRRPFPRDLLLFPERRRPFPRDLLLFPERRRPFPRDLLLFLERRRPFPRDLLLFTERRRPFPRDLLLFPERRRPFPRDLLLFPGRRRPFPRELLLFPERRASLPSGPAPLPRAPAALISGAAPLPTASGVPSLGSCSSSQSAGGADLGSCSSGGGEATAPFRRRDVAAGDPGNDPVDPAPASGARWSTVAPMLRAAVAAARPLHSSPRAPAAPRPQRPPPRLRRLRSSARTSCSWAGPSSPCARRRRAPRRWRSGARGSPRWGATRRCGAGWARPRGSSISTAGR